MVLVRFDAWFLRLFALRAWLRSHMSLKVALAVPLRSIQNQSRAGHPAIHGAGINTYIRVVTVWNIIELFHSHGWSGCGHDHSRNPSEVKDAVKQAILEVRSDCAFVA